MHYVDLNRRKHQSQKRGKRNLTVYILIAVVILLAGFYFLPVLNVFKNIISSPTVLSFIRDPKQQLAQTDERTNILLLGIDKRANVPYSYKVGNGEVRKNGFLADTMVVASLDFKTKGVSMLSIPRDLWVPIPGWDGNKGHFSKINATYSIGETLGYPGGGAALAKAVVSKQLDIPIHYVVRTDFEGFKKAVDTVGGITVDVETSFEDGAYPREGHENDPVYNNRYEYVSFKKGSIAMDGDLALKYVRSRHGTNGEGSDFARARRQQRAMLALRAKALSLQILTDPNKLASLADSFGESVYFDIPLSGLLKLYGFAKDLDLSQVKNGVLDHNGDTQYLVSPPQADYGGAWVLIPRNNDWGPVQLYAKTHLGIISPTPTPVASRSASSSTRSAKVTQAP